MHEGSEKKNTRLVAQRRFWADSALSARKETGLFIDLGKFPVDKEPFPERVFKGRSRFIRRISLTKKETAR